MHDQTGQTRRPARSPGNVFASSTRRRPAKPFTGVESLEPRAMFAVQAPVVLSIANPNIDVSPILENQHSGSIAVNLQDPANVYVVGVQDARFTGPLDDRDADLDNFPDPLPLFELEDTDPLSVIDRGVFGSVSLDAGQNYVNTGLAFGATSPSVTFDEFGNLFVAYYARSTGTGNIFDPNDPFDPNNPSFGFVDDSTVEVMMSTDKGITFTPLMSFAAPGIGNLIDTTSFFIGSDTTTTTTASVQPKIATGAGSVWVSFERNREVVASGARVLGLGAVEAFSNPQGAFRSEGGRFADIAIGSNGEVVVTYQILRNDPDVGTDTTTFATQVTISADGTITTAAEPSGSSDIYTNIDPDGVGPELFGKRSRVTGTKVGVSEPISAQSEFTINAAPGIAIDRSGGPFNGRVWLVYTDSTTNRREDDTDVLVRFSDDGGSTWSSPRSVVDESTTRASQFLPQIAVDQITGNVAISWYDTRVQSGISFGPNDETTYWATVGVPTTAEAGIAFSDNIKISDGISDVHRSRNLVELGEYSGLDFYNNVVYPVWADNSNSTGTNPSGGIGSGTNLATLDLYTSRIVVTPATAVPPEQAPVGPGSPLTPLFVGKDTVTKGSSYKFQVRFQSDAGIDLASFGDDDLLITGPQGYNLFADFLKAKSSKQGTVVTATYQAFAPGGKFDVGDNGLYSILVQAGAVRSLANVTTTAGLLDQFLVSSTAPAQSPALQAAPAASAALKAVDGEDDLINAVGL